MLEKAVRTCSSAILPCTLPSSQRSRDLFVSEERLDSFRLTPISDYIRDRTHAFRLVEAPKRHSEPDARIHAVHWFRAEENGVLSEIQGRSISERP